MSYAILKSCHVIAILAWSAGLFYIGRLFVYYVESPHSETRQVLTTMARRLNNGIIWPASIIGTLIGLHLIGVVNALSQPWFHTKALFLIALFGYQHALSRIIKRMSANAFTRSATWCRVFNEVPIVLLTGIVFSAVTKDAFIGWGASGIVVLMIGLFFGVRYRR
jgi:putative membrane protein